MDEDARVDVDFATGATGGLSPLQTEFEFTLPRGYVDEEETLHREGKMRLATAADEIVPLKDPRVRANESYLTVILLSRVITSLGTVEDVSTHVVENLFISDLAYLQDLYERINARSADVVEAVCPTCDETFEAVIDPDSPDRAHAHSHGPADADGSTDTDADADATGSSQPAPDTDASPAGRGPDGAGRPGPSIRVGRPIRGEAGVGSGNSGGDSGSDPNGPPDQNEEREP